MFSAQPARRINTSQLRSIVVVPSRTINKWHEPAAETQAYEERLLCLLLGLSDPDLHVTYVTSSPIAPAIVDHYLSLLAPARRRAARARLTLLSANDATSRPLSEKLLERPLLLHQIRRAIPDPQSCHLVPYTTTPLERDVALELGIPMHGADPRHAHLGTKSGCRELFAAAGVAHPLGVEHIYSVPAAIDAIAGLRARKPEIQQLVMKLNEGVSGEGNAIVDLRGLPAPGARAERAAIAERITGMALEAQAVGLERYLGCLAAHGGIVEERIVGRRGPQPERAAGDQRGRRGRDRLDARPAARRRQRPELPGLPLPGRARLRAADRRAGPEGRTAPGRRGRDRAIGDRLRRRAPRRWRLGCLRHRAQPAQGRHHASVRGAGAADRRDLRHGLGDLRHAGRGRARPTSPPTTSRRRPCGRWDAAARCPRSPARACASTTSARRAS